MPRVVSNEMVQELGSPVDLIFSVAVHSSVVCDDEQLSFSMGGAPLQAREIVDTAGNRFHRLVAGPGLLEIRYRASISLRAPKVAGTEAEMLTMLRPSRYCESDELFGFARRTFAGLSGHALIAAVRSYVHSTLTYDPGATTPTDSASTTLAAGRGVCRDFAHSVIALLRAMDVPARYTSCYAPGLRPMDFHAVAEAYVDGEWIVIDATGLADRRELVRIAVGRDASDCAFLSFHGGSASLKLLRTDAFVSTTGVLSDPDPLADDPLVPVQMG